MPLRRLCEQLRDYGALLGNVDPVSAAVALHRAGFDGLYALDEADPAVFGDEPAPLRDVLGRLIERCTLQGRGESCGSVRFVVCEFCCDVRFASFAGAAGG